MARYYEDAFEYDIKDPFSEEEEHRRIQQRKWLTREMLEIDVVDLTDAHLINAYNMLLKGSTGHFPKYTDEAISMLGAEVEKRGLGERARLMRS